MEALERRIGGNLITTSYVVEVGGARVEIDPGPPNAYSPARVDYALCTHIHNDHCGAAGHVGVPVYVHGRYADHVANPAKLWEATKRALGPIAEIFGEPRPAAEVKPLKDGERLFDAIDAYFTPGHAPHHVMFHYRDEGVLFVGDGAGVYVPWIGAVFPTTPAPFRYEEYVESLHKVASIGARTLCYPHFACTEEVDLLRRHMEQIAAWRESAEAVASRGGSVEDLIQELRRSDEAVEKAVEAGGLLYNFFLKQSVAGLLDYAAKARRS